MCTVVPARAHGLDQTRAMRSTLHTRCLEIHTIEEFDHRFAALTGEAASEQIVIQGVDLSGGHQTRTILGLRWSLVTFLGCRLDDEGERHAIATGATVFPPFDDIPYDPYRGHLYTAAELAADDLDSRIYLHQAQFRHHEPKPILEALAQRIHDHAVDDALEDYLHRHERVVAIMGGHSQPRDDAAC